MEKRRLVNKTEMGKENFKRISSKQLEARITAFTVILAVIVMNILWWTGTQFLELNNNHNITETAKPFNQQGHAAPINPVIGESTQKGVPVSKFKDTGTPFFYLLPYHSNKTVSSRAPCAPITSACSISAVFDGPEMNTP